jgi:DNA adenine methylase
MTIGELQKRPDMDALRVRAKATLSTTPRPFVRWAGSKQRLLNQIIEHLPETLGRYVDPFLGGGALYFCLQPANAILADSCEPLVNAYRAVRDNVAAVKRLASDLDPLDEELYYEVRGAPAATTYKSAAEFLFLNHSGWNGLYRVNSHGRFNVPYGRPASSVFFDSANLTACSELLGSQRCQLHSQDFRKTLDQVVSGDFVFLDPPYVTGHNNNGFVDYNEKLFSWKDQEDLASKASELADLGARVLITNAHHAEVIKLYPKFSLHTIRRNSTLAGDVSARGQVSEALLTSY